MTDANTCATEGHEWATDHENDPMSCIHCGALAPLANRFYREAKPLSRQRRADLRKREQGWRRVPVWFSPEDLARLSRLAVGAGSEQEAVRQCVRGVYQANYNDDPLDKTPTR